MSRQLQRARVWFPVALLVACVIAGSIGPAVAADLETVRARAQAVADEVSEIERDLARLEDREARLRELIEEIDMELAGLSVSISRWDEAEREARAAYERQAIEAYKSGGVVDLDILLHTQTMGDLFDLIEFNAALTVSYAADARAVSDANAEVRTAQERADERKQELMETTRAVEAIQERLRSKLDERRDALQVLTAELKELERQARAEAAAKAESTGVPASEALLGILAGSGPAAGIPDGFVPTGVSFEGLASWYGPGFEGNPTANGDIFDPNLYTAASKELPLPTWLYIEYGGRGVVVYVNDRGPYVGERILDLSRAAAEAIGLTGPGVGWVKAHILLPQ